jgi:hypothetical protein
MESRARYLKFLERDLDASKKVIDTLTQENHELKEILKMITHEKPNIPIRTCLGT